MEKCEATDFPSLCRLTKAFPSWKVSGVSCARQWRNSCCKFSTPTTKSQEKVKCGLNRVEEDKKGLWVGVYADEVSGLECDPKKG